MKNSVISKMKLATVMFCALLVFAAEAHAAKVAPAAALDINQAGVAELSTIPGIGAAKAQAIVEYRAAKPFTSTEELVGVKGIGEKLYAKIAPYVTVSGKAQAPGTAEKAVR